MLAAPPFNKFRSPCTQIFEPGHGTLLRTARGPYRLAASLLGAESHDPRHPLGPGAGILVTLAAPGAGEAFTGAPLTNAELRERYRLTPREAAVARLLAARRGAAEIAQALGVSRHTARRHTEHVYDKLRVHHRAEVGAHLRVENARTPGTESPG